MPASRRAKEPLLYRARGSLGPSPSCPDFVTSVPRDGGERPFVICRPHPGFSRIPLPCWVQHCWATVLALVSPPGPLFPPPLPPGNLGQSPGACMQGLGVPTSPLDLLPFPVRNFPPLSSHHHSGWAPGHLHSAVSPGHGKLGWARGLGRVLG